MRGGAAHGPCTQQALTGGVWRCPPPSAPARALLCLRSPPRLPDSPDKLLGVECDLPGDIGPQPGKETTWKTNDKSPRRSQTGERQPWPPRSFVSVPSDPLPRCPLCPAGPPCRVTVIVPQSLVTPASRLASPRCLTACAMKGPGLGPLPQGSAALKVLSVWPLPRHENKFTRRTTRPEARTSGLHIPRLPSALEPDPGSPGATPEPALHSPSPLLQLPQARWGRSLGHPNWNALPGTQAGG